MLTMDILIKSKWANATLAGAGLMYVSENLEIQRDVWRMFADLVYLFWISSAKISEFHGIMER